MALGLAIIVVVIVGVMGAGLLTLAATDLRAIMEVNRGEQAFELAEAGIEVAKAHLANDSSQADWALGELNMAGMNEGSVVSHRRTRRRERILRSGLHRRVPWDEAQDRSHPLHRRRQAKAPELAGTLRIRPGRKIVDRDWDDLAVRILGGMASRPRRWRSGSSSCAGGLPAKASRCGHKLKC